MRKAWPMISLEKVLNHRKEFIQIDDVESYKRCRVQLHTQGIILRDIVPGAEIKTKKQQVCKAGDFLVAEIDAKVGGFGIVPEELAGAIVSSHYFLFEIDNTHLDKRFLDYFIRTPFFREQVAAQGSTNYAAIRPKDVLEYKISLPPLSEQKRIVTKIEELAEEIEEAQGLRRQTHAEAEALIEATVSNLFPQPVIWCSVRDVVKKVRGAVRSGPFGSQLLHEEFVPYGVAAIGTRDVHKNLFELRSGWFVTKSKFERMKRYQVFPGDILCTIVGGSIGRFCVVPDDIPMAFTTKHVQALTLDTGIAEPRFVSYVLNYHHRCRKSLFRQVEGSAQPSLNAEKILATSLPIPLIHEQRRIVAYLNNLQSKIDDLKRLQSETQKVLDGLMPSILDKAFKGEL